MLLEYGVDINSDDGEGGHALHAAACHQRSHVVQLLVDHGADVHLESAKYRSPLLAALKGCMAPKFRSWARAEPAKSLAKALPLPAPLFDFYSRFCRTSGSRLGYKDFAECERIVRILVDHGAEINTSPGRFGNALHLASFVGSLYDCSWTRVRMSMLPAATSRLRSWQPWKATTQPFLSFS
jgi:ankyrin repeat protein